MTYFLRAKLSGSYLIAVVVTLLATSTEASFVSQYMALAPNQNLTCSAASDCPNPTFEQCQGGYCAHKSVFPATWPEIGGAIILPLLLGFANNGGIGGGGLIIPVCIAMFGFNTIQAIALSNFVIFTGAIVRYLGFSIFQKNPNKDATIVDYNLCAMMLPLVMVGSFVGTIISSVMPEAVLTMILIVVLFYLTYDSLEKAVGLWKKETIAFRAEEASYKALPATQEEKKQQDALELTKLDSEAKQPSNLIDQKQYDVSLNQPVRGKSESIDEAVSLKSLAVDYNQASNLEIQHTLKILKRDRSNLAQWRVHLMCAALVSLAFVVTLFRGSKKNPSIVNMQKCGSSDVVILLGFLFVCFIICFLQINRCQLEEQLKKVTKMGTCKSDISYNGKSLVQLVIAAIGGGFASSVGLGGGVVWNPTIIGLGFPPAACAATGMYMIMFSAFSNCLTFWLFGSLDLRFALWLGLWSGLGIYIFLSIVGSIIKKYRRPSIIVFFLGGVIALSSIAVPVINIQNLVKMAQIPGHSIWGFGKLC